LEDDGSNLLRYLAHGLVLSVLLIILIFGWAFLAIILVLCGWIIGLLVALVLIPFVYGYANTFVMEIVWTQNMDHEWKVVFIHGLFLFIVLLVVGLPVTLANYVFHSMALVIILFLVYIPINGYIAKKIGDGYIVAMETVQLGIPLSPAWMNKAPLEGSRTRLKISDLGHLLLLFQLPKSSADGVRGLHELWASPSKETMPGLQEGLALQLKCMHFLRLSIRGSP
jgi:hypothetical protein